MSARTGIVPVIGGQRFYLEQQVRPRAWQRRDRPGVLVTSDIRQALILGAPVAFGLSGGKCSAAMALAGNAYLDGIGHTGPRICTHADLGRVEHRAAHESAARVAAFLGLPLHVARREAGDLVDRFWQRWHDNLERYINLRCVQLIMPWPGPHGLFCRSEVKVAPQLRMLVRLFPGQTIINAVGIRAEESANRAKQPISKVQPGLRSVTYKTNGYNWNPIHAFRLVDVLAIHARRGFPLPDHYTIHDSDRFSCRFCVVASLRGWEASLDNPESHPNYTELVEIEVESGFGMTERRWLVDVRPELLPEAIRSRIPVAKALAAKRQMIEGEIPRHLRYVKGWPVAVPTREDAAVLASVRSRVGALMDLPVRYTTASEVRDRYAELLEEKAIRAAKRPSQEEEDTLVAD